MSSRALIPPELVAALKDATREKSPPAGALFKEFAADSEAAKIIEKARIKRK